MSFSTTIDIPSWICFGSTSPELVSFYGIRIAKVICVWRNQMQVEFFTKDGKSHIGIYSLHKFTWDEPTLSDWIDHAVYYGDVDVSLSKNA